MSVAASRWEGQTLEQLRARWRCRQVHLYSRIGSTNDRAKELAEANVPAGTVVVADEQSAGRGLGSRRWHSPPGAGLYLSLVLRPEVAPNPLVIPLLAGLAVAQAVRRLLDGARVGIKWPNDLIVNDRKAGGVLSESSWSERGPKHVVVGVGVNVHQAPADFPRSLRPVATSLDMAAGRAVSRLALADRVISEVEDRCRVLPENLDPEFLLRFAEYDWLRGRRCQVVGGEAPRLVGAVVGIAADGALLFQPDDAAAMRVTAGRVIVDELTFPDY